MGRTERGERGKRRSRNSHDVCYSTAHPDGASFNGRPFENSYIPPVDKLYIVACQAFSCDNSQLSYVAPEVYAPTYRPSECNKLVWKSFEFINVVHKIVALHSQTNSRIVEVHGTHEVQSGTATICADDNKR